MNYESTTFLFRNGSDDSQVAYEAPFDVNETFAETFEKFMGEQASA